VIREIWYVHCDQHSKAICEIWYVHSNQHSKVIREIWYVHCDQHSKVIREIWYVHSDQHSKVMREIWYVHSDQHSRQMTLQTKCAPFTPCNAHDSQMIANKILVRKARDLYFCGTVTVELALHKQQQQMLL
jgi:hypothetical protein